LTPSSVPSLALLLKHTIAGPLFARQIVFFILFDGNFSSKAQYNYCLSKEREVEFD
jgi:hypothetical protein